MIVKFSQRQCIEYYVLMVIDKFQQQQITKLLNSFFLFFSSPYKRFTFAFVYRAHHKRFELLNRYKLKFIINFMKIDLLIYGRVMELQLIIIIYRISICQYSFKP